MSASPSDFSTDQLVGFFIQLRDAKADAKAKYDAELAKFDVQMDTIEAELARRMETDNHQSIRTDMGTVTRSIKVSFSAVDKGAIADYIITNVDAALKSNNPIAALDALSIYESRISSTKLKELEANGVPLPPGVHREAAYTIVVRKPTKK